MDECDFNVVLTWWQGLEDDRGGRAELRRAHNPTEVVFLPAYHRLYGECGASNIDKEALACAAGYVPHTRGDEPEIFFRLGGA